MIRVGRVYSLEESLGRYLGEVEHISSDLEHILELDDVTFQNPFILRIVLVTIKDAQKLLNKVYETQKAISYWQSRGKDTSKISSEW